MGGHRDGWMERKKVMNVTEGFLPQAAASLLCYDHNIQTGRTAGTSLNHCVLCLA